MRRFTLWPAMLVFGLTASTAFAAPANHAPASGHADVGSRQSLMQRFATPQQSVTDGSVTVGGHTIHYKAVAGTLVLHGKGDDEGTPTVRMFYVAYLKKGAQADKRPLTFLYNGGPGSASLWLHMGAFGPHRVDTSDHTHTPAAPYTLVNNNDSLLDASDLVFIDAPGTGFSRLLAVAKTAKKRKALLKKRAKHFYSVDGDAHAFATFISRFLSKYQRWNSPKYLFGESYGTTRSAAVAKILETRDNVDLNGVILLSQILNFSNSIDNPQTNPGDDRPYELALPTYTATAWYHHKLPQQSKGDLQALLKQSEAYAMGPYARALDAGSTLSSTRKRAVAEKLHQLTGLSTAYLLKADLRVNGPEFEKNLMGDSDTTTGRLDARFSGPTMDPLSKEAQYDPQSAAISSAYVALFNNYVRKQLKFGQDDHYRLYAPIKHWKFQHGDRQQATNVMPDLADAMKYNPELKVLLNGGYFDLATPFYAAIDEMHHLPMPNRLQKNISYDFYRSGHMVYAHLPSLKKLHDNVAGFIRNTEH